MARKISDEQLNVTVTVNGDEARTRLSELSKANKALKNDNLALAAAKKKLAAEGKKNTEEYKNLTQEIKKNNVKLGENKQEHKQLQDQIGLTGKTMRELKTDARKLQAQLDQEVKGTQEYNRLQKELVETKSRMSELKTETYQMQKAMGSADNELSQMGASLGDVMSGLKTGNLQAVKAGFMGVATGIRSAASSALAFAATPIGAAITALAAVVGVTAMWFNYNKEIAKSVKLTQQLTNFDGEELSQYRASVQATADTFDKEFNEVLKSANSLSKQMGISQQEALSLIEQGLVRGADANGDFLDKVREYPVQFKNAGYSAQDFIDIATQEAKGGIFNDKLIDAIKEADLALKEMTKTQQDALKNAFGQQFTNEIAQGLKTGELNTKQTLDRIIAKSNELGLNAQQQQQLVADLFKGAGEDAGGFAEIIDQINQAFDEQSKTLNDNEAATQRLAEANSEYEQALAQLFDSSQSGFPAMLTNIKSIGQEIQTSVLTGLRRMFTSIAQLKQQAGLEGQAEAVERISENTKLFSSNAREEAEIQISAAEKNIGRLKTKLEDLNFLQRIGGTDTVYEEKIAKEEAYLAELRNIAQAESQLFVDYQAKLEEEKNATVKFNANNGNTEDEDDATSPAVKKAEKEAEQIKAKRQKLAEWLEAFDEEQRIKDATKYLEDIDAQQLRDELELENKYIKLEEDAVGEVELLKELEENKLLALQEIRDKYGAIRKQNEINTLDEIAAAEKAQKQKLIQAEDAFAAAKGNALSTGLQLLANFANKSSAIYKGIFLIQKSVAIAEIIANASKAIAIAQANELAVPAILPPGIPNPSKPISIAATATQIATTKLTAGISIGAILGETVQGFEDGYYPWEQTVTRDDGKKFNAIYGGLSKTQVVSRPTLLSDYLVGEGHKKELVVDNKTFNRLDPSVISHIMNVSRGVPGYEQGFTGDTAKSFTQDTTQDSSLQQDEQLEMQRMTMSLLMKLNSTLSKPIQATAAIGYQEAENIEKLNTERNNSQRKATPQ